MYNKKDGDKMVKNQMYTVIGVAISVAIIISIIATSITGNIIKVQETKTGPDVYTKTEIDIKMADAISPKQLISYLADAIIVTPSIVSIKNTVSKSTDCRKECNNVRRDCILSIYQTRDSKLAKYSSAPVACGEVVTISSDNSKMLSCVCGVLKKIIPS